MKLQQIKTTKMTNTQKLCHTLAS